MKLKIISVVIAALMIIGVLGYFYVDSTRSIFSVSVIIDTGEGVETVSLYEKDGKYYAFLPSYADLRRVQLDSSLGYSVYVDDKDCSDISFETNKEYKLTLENVLGIQVFACVMVVKQSENIPALSISLADGTIEDINNNINTQKSGIVSIITSESEIDYRGAFAVLEGRGNSSWWQVKKPYNLKFNKPVGLLGMDSALNWVLLANAMDESHIRNKIVYDAAISAGLEHSVESRYVDLYIDGDYFGLYLLTERIEVGENRVDITNLYEQTQQLNQYRLDTYEKSSYTNEDVFQKAFSIPNNPSDITGGYLLEFELAERAEQEDNLFKTVSGRNITVKSPQTASLEQMKYISSFVQRLENSLGTDEYVEYIDAESWARYYLIQEFFLNDSRTSYFFYKDTDEADGKMYAGPIWDFDLSIGTVYERADSNPIEFRVNNWGWFKVLYNNPSFYQIVVSEYKNTLRPIFSEIIEQTAASYSDDIKASYEMNELRWNDSQYNWWVNRYDTQSEHVEYITNYLKIRLSLFDDVFINNIPYETILANNSDDDALSDDNAVSTPKNENADSSASSDGIVNKIKTLVIEIYNNLGIIIVGVMALIVCVIVFVDCMPALRRRFGRGKD